jgi:hypothetical protein
VGKKAETATLECFQRSNNNINRFANCSEDFQDNYSKEQVLAYYRLNYVESMYTKCLTERVKKLECQDEAVKLSNEVIESTRKNFERL